MNVIFNRFSGSLSKKMVLRMIKETGVKNCYSICAKAGEIYPEDVQPLGCSVRQFDAYDTYNGIYKDINWNTIEPLDEKILFKFAKLEAEILRMMEKERPLYTPLTVESLTGEERDEAEKIVELRPHKYLSSITGLTVDERKRLYYRHLRFWIDFFNKNKVDLLVFANSVHYIYEYIMFRVAESLGIPSITGYFTMVPGRWIVNKGISEFGFRLKDTYLELKEKYKPEEITFKEFYQKEWERLTAPYDKQVKPYYGDLAQWEQMVNNNRFVKEHDENQVHKKLKISIPWHKRIKSIVKRRFDIDFIHYKNKIKNHNRLKEKISNFYESLCTEPDFNKNYIYFPLHMQPEETTAPKGGVFADQSLIVQMLSYYLPEGWYIYIKEHHAQMFKHRNGEFYLDLYKNPKVKLISKDVSTFKLSQYCKAVATITGTAGWEACFKGKPVLLFGYVIYRYAPGVFVIRNNEDCEKAIKTIVNDELKLDINDMKYYLKAIEMGSVEAAVNPEEIEFLGISNEENLERMSGAFIKFMKANGYTAPEINNHIAVNI